MNNWERMKAGRLYNADSKDLEQYHKFGMETCDKFNRTPLWRKKRKQRLLEKLIPSAKDGGAAIFAPFYCEYGVNIHFGKGCFVNYKCTFLDCAPITLEDGVWVGANVTIATPCHPFLSDDCIVAGVPAKVLRKLDEQDRMQVWDTYMKNEVPMSERERGRK